MNSIAAVITMMRDESDILPDWLAYCLAIFGKGNVYVLDHGSTDNTKLLLERSAGQISFSRVKGPYSEKGRLVTDLMRTLRDKYDLLVPLDVDEFPFSADRQTLEGTKEVFTQIANDYHSASIFSFDNEWTGVPTLYPVAQNGSWLSGIAGFKVLTRRDPRWGPKKFFRGNAFVSTDGGNHNGVVHSGTIMSSGLALYHFPYRSKSQTKRKYRNGAEAFNYWRDRGDIGTHWKAGYEHLLNGTFDEHYKAIASATLDYTGIGCFQQLIHDARKTAVI